MIELKKKRVVVLEARYIPSPINPDFFLVILGQILINIKARITYAQGNLPIIVDPPAHHHGSIIVHHLEIMIIEIGIITMIGTYHQGQTQSIIVLIISTIITTPKMVPNIVTIDRNPLFYTKIPQTSTKDR